MAYTALTDAALDAREPLVMDWILEARSGAQARAGDAWTTIKLVSGPSIRRGGTGFYASCDFSVDRLWVSGKLSYADDYDPANPLQTGSEVRIKCRVYVDDPAEEPVLYEEDYVFRGHVYKVSIEDERLSVTAYDRLAVCKRAVAEVARESDIHHTYSGTLTLERDGTTNNLRLPIATYPDAWWNDGVNDLLRSWQPGAIHIYKNGETDPLPGDSWKAFYQDGIITLSDTPSGTYELRQDGDGYTLAVYAMTEAEGAITVGSILGELLMCKKWSDPVLGKITAVLGPGFTAGELNLSPGQRLSSFYWALTSGSVEDAIAALTGERYSGNYKIMYDPASDTVIGLDENDFTTKANNVRLESPVYDVDELYMIRNVNQDRDIDEMDGAVLVKGMQARAAGILTAADSAKITVLLDGSWTVFSTLQPFVGWDSVANLLNGKWGDVNNSIGLAYLKLATIGDKVDFIEIDLGTDTEIGLVMLAGPCGNTTVNQVQVWIYGKADGGDYKPICAEADGGLLGVKEAKTYEVTAGASFRYIKVAMIASFLKGGTANGGVVGLAEIQLHSPDEMKSLEAVQEEYDTITETYYPELVDKYYSIGLPVKVDDRGLIRSQEELDSRAKNLVYWGVRAPRGFILESGQPDPRALLYMTTQITCVYNEPVARPILIESVELSPDGVKLEGTDYYTEGWVELA